MKKLGFSILILAMASCTSIDRIMGNYDPYENIPKKKKVVEVKEVKIETKEIITLSKQDINILNRFKTEYNLVESIEDIEKKTLEAVNKLQVKPIHFISKVNEILKATKTKSYTFAISRAMNNWR